MPKDIRDYETARECTMLKIHFKQATFLTVYTTVPWTDSPVPFTGIGGVVTAPGVQASGVADFSSANICCGKVTLPLQSQNNSRLAP